MLNPMSMELLAEQVQRDHLARVAHEALLAQLPRSTAAHPSFTRSLAAQRLAIASTTTHIANFTRLHTANALRTLATRLDPCAACDQGLVRIVSSR
jgi:hypothetical protein